MRDGSDWEKTLKPRLHNRLNNSKNIILFLTKNSKALREEMNFGIGTLELPVIVVYPEYSEKSDIINCGTKTFKQQIKNLWDKLSAFRDSMNSVPTLIVASNISIKTIAKYTSHFQSDSNVSLFMLITALICCNKSNPIIPSNSKP